MRTMGGMVFALCLLGLAATAWAGQAGDVMMGGGTISGTITRIEGNRLTVREDAGRESTTAVKSTHGLKVGGRVRVVGCTGSVTAAPCADATPIQTSGPPQPPGGEKATLPGPLPRPGGDRPSAIPEPIPRPGGGKVGDLPGPLPRPGR